MPRMPWEPPLGWKEKRSMPEISHIYLPVLYMISMMPWQVLSSCRGCISRI